MRIGELDALRGLAALGVVLFHYTYKYEQIFNDGVMNKYIFNYGFLGVQLFFIISGFVIFMTISKVKSGKEFVLKRFFRLYPVFWICLIITFIITSLSGIERFERTFMEFLLNFTMIPDLFKARMIDGVYWSLLPELLFYGIVLIIFLFRLLHRIEIIMFIWLLISFISIRVVGNPVISTLIVSNYSYLFIAGICFFKIYTKKGDVSHHLLIITCLLYCFFLVSIIEFIITIIFFLLFYLFVFKKLIFLNTMKPLIYLGRISYPLYLIHQFIGLILIQKLFTIGITDFYLLLLIPITITIFVSWLISSSIEKPIHSLLRTRTLSFSK